MNRFAIVVAACAGLIFLISVFVVKLLQARRRGVSVRMQIFFALASIVGTFALALGLLVVDRVEARAERLARAAAQDEARVIASLLQAELKRSALPLAELAKAFENLQELSPAATDPAAHRTKSLFPPSDHIFDAGFEIYDDKKHRIYPANVGSVLSNDTALYEEVPLHTKQGLQGYVRVVKPTLAIEKMLADFAPMVLIVSLVLVAAAALAAAAIGRAIAAPIEALTLFSEQVSQGERVGPPSAATGREVSQLVGSIETMRKRLEGRPFVETFAADLSHELKNPVAAIRASAEVLEEGALDEPEEAQRFVARIREAALRIQLLLEELLSLAEVEAQGVEGLEKLDVAELTRRVIAELGFEKRVELQIHENLKSVRANPLWLARAISNLTRNAVLHSEHSATEERAVINLSTLGSEICISTVNPGSIPPHLHRSLFRRFVTTRGDRGGTGLGLAIARAVAEAHGGRLGLADAGPPHVRFELFLPIL
ncbi:MAG: ATP-binding protein [Polyangiaceae bacterium]|nr:ATP-binding protein [Polyangiaceae bacterium]